MSTPSSAPPAPSPPPSPSPYSAGGRISRLRGLGPSGRARQIWLLIGSLYVAQAVPMGFFRVAMPVILRDSGVSLEAVGLFSAISLPWLLKFLWAPVVDRWGSGRRGHYRSWILPLQTLAVATVATIAWLGLGAPLAWLLGLSLLFMLLAATQDIATDGLSVRVLDSKERGWANGVQVGGYYLGQVLGGAGVLIVFSRFGWAVALFAMAAFLALPLWPASRFREEPAAPEEASGRSRRIDYAAMGRLVRRAGWAWMLLLVAFRAGEEMATYVYTQMLVDLGFGIETVGLISGAVYASGALAGALVGGWLVARWGRRRTLVLFGLCQAAAISTYTLPTLGVPSLGTAASVAFLVATCGGMATAALYTSMMDHADPRTAGTDFTFQQSVCAFGPLAGTILSGFLAGALGFAGYFLICGGIALVCVGLVVLARLAPLEGGAGADSTAAAG